MATTETRLEAPPAVAPFRWKRSLYTLCVAQLMATVAFSSAIPFMPLYLQELGIRDRGENALWAGVLASGAALLMALASPFWGTVADRFGRKMMVTRVLLADAVVIGLMGLAPNAIVLLVLRLLMGMLGGFAGAVNALVTTIVPREKISHALGLSQTMMFIGSMCGPVIGGGIADRFGFRPAFFFTGVVCALVGFAVVFFVEERFSPPPAGKMRASGQARVAEMLTNRQLMAMAGALFGLQFAALMVMPMMPLYVQSLGVDPKEVATSAGLALAVGSLPSAVTAMNTGRIAGRFGLKWMLAGCALGAGLLTLPQALVGGFRDLLVLRVFMGFFVGGVFPAANAIVGQSTPPERRATAFGVSSSATLFGQAAGPMAAGVLTAAIGLRDVFFVSGVMLLLVTCLAVFAVREPTMSEDGGRGA